MDRQEALEVLGIVSNKNIVDTIKFEYKDFLFKGKDKEGIIKRIEACKILTDGHEDQAKIFSGFVVSAIEDSHLDFLRSLLETVKNSKEFDYLNTENTVGNIPLNSVLENKHNKCESRLIAVNLLLEYGANPNTKDRKGKSSLHCIVENENGNDNFGHIVTELLFKYNADPNIEDNQGRTPLHTLCIKHQYSNSELVEIAKLLVRKGANLDLKDKDGKKAVHYVNPKTDVGRLLGATDKDAVWIHSGGAAFCLFLGTACMIESTVGSFSKADRTMCAILALISVPVALYFAYHLKEELQKQPSPELVEAKAEFLNSQKR